MYSDFALRTVLYTILCIGAIGISTGKLFAINHGISKYLAKKSYSGNFKAVKTTFISLGIEYVSIAIIALFISLCTINTIYTNAFFDELLPEFFSTAVTVFAIVVLGAECDFGLWLLFAIPYTFLIIANILILFFVNYKFVYKDFETSVYKGYKQDKIEMRGDRAEMSDFPLYLNTVAGGLDRRDQTIGGFSFVVKIYAVPVVEIIG